MYYDSYYNAKPTSLGHVMNNKLNRLLAETIMTLIDLKKTVKICEVGYGRGLLADMFRFNNKYKVDYYAIEPNHLLAEQGRSKGDHIVETKIPPFPTDTGWDDFDVIIFSHVIEHFDHYETILTVLEEAIKKLKTDGLAVVFFPDYLDYKEDFFSACHSHEYVLTQRRMENLFNDAHIKIIKSGVYRSCFRFPYSSLIYPFHVIIKTIAGIFWNLTGRDLFFKMKITFAKNILMIARKE